MTDQTSRKTIGVAVLAALGMAAAAPQAGAGLPASGLPTLELDVVGITFEGRGALSLGVEAGIAQGESDSFDGTASASGSFGGAIEGFSGGEGVEATVTVFDGGGLATAGRSSSGTFETGGLGATSGTFQTSASGLDAFSDAAVQAGAFGLGIVSDDLGSDDFGVHLDIPEAPPAP